MYDAESGQNDEDGSPLDGGVDETECKGEKGTQDVCSHDPDTNQADHPASGVRGRDLAHVDWRVGEEHTGADTADNATHDEHFDIDSSGL
jgi:hypothetical protein